MSIPKRHESPTSSQGVPAPASDAIDALVEAVSTGVRISPGSTSDPSNDAIPAITLPPTTTGAWRSARLARRIAVVLLAFGLGLGGAIWGLRTFEPIGPPADRTSAPPEPKAAPPSSPPARVDLLPSRELRPLTSFAARTASRRAFQTAAGVESRTASRTEERGSSLAREASPTSDVLLGAPNEIEASPLTIDTIDTIAPRENVAESAAAATPERIVPKPSAPIAPLEAPAARVARDSAAVGTEAAEEAAVMDTVEGYADALEQLDVSAAAALWPTVDRRTLGRAFSSLRAQDVAFDDCDVALASTTATARCQGTTQYIAKVGGATPRTGRFEWLFRLRRLDDGWKIESVTAWSAAGTSRDQQ